MCIITSCSHDGRLGLGNEEDQSYPVPLECFEYLRVTMIAAGGSHSACITSNGDLWTWGDGCKLYKVYKIHRQEALICNIFLFV